MKVMMRNMSGASAMAMTAAERAAGRFMRAPDHDASGGGDAGNGEGSGADAGTDSAGAAADQGGDAVNNQQGGDKGGDAGTILGEAAKGDDAGGEGQPGDAKGEGEQSQDEGPRLTFGEGDAAAPILGAPEAYDLKAPEGMSFDKDAFAAVEPVLKELNLSNDAAQAVVNAYAEKIIPLMAERAKAEGEALGNDMRREWAEEAAKQFDGKEGRPSLQEAKALSRQAFLRFGVGGKEDDPFLQLLEDSGLGNHPVLINTMAMIGRAVGEGGIETGGAQPAPQRLADRIYGQPIKPA